MEQFKHSSIKEKFRKIRHNHQLMMLICCGVPLILLVGAVYLFGLNNKYLFWGIFLLCPIMHFFMMRNRHKKHHDKKDDGCH